MVKRVPVESASIAWIDYNPTKRELEIQFRQSGDVYRYFDVPSEEYAALAAAESKGAYLNQVFKPRAYRYVIVRRGKS